MKTMKARMIMMAFATCATVYSFGQVNLAVQSTTQAAANAAVNVAAVTNAAHTATQAVKTVAATSSAATRAISVSNNSAVSVSTGLGLSAASQPANGNITLATGNASVIPDAGNLPRQIRQTATSTTAAAKGIKSKALTETRQATRPVRKAAAAVEPNARVDIHAGTKSPAGTR